MSLAIASSARRSRILPWRDDTSASGTLGSVPTIVVVDDDASERNALAGMLRDVFPPARVVGGRTDDPAGVHERDAAVLVVAELTVVERVRHRLPVSARVLALTREMGPETLLRAEALGVAAVVRAPATTRRLRAVLESMLGGTMNLLLQPKA